MRSTRKTDANGGGSGEALILAAMVVVSITLGVALGLQGGIGMIGAAIGGIVAFGVMAAIHALMRRQVALQSRITALESALAGESPESDPLGAASNELSHMADRMRGTNDYGDGEGADYEDDAPLRPAHGAAKPVPMPDFDHGWGEQNQVVDNLVRQLAENLEHEPPAKAPPIRAAATRTAAPPRAQAAAPHPQMPAPPMMPPAMPAAAPAAPSRRPAFGPNQRVAEAVEQAVANGEIEIHLQPIISLNDRKPRFYDVFPRLKDSDGRLITPVEYWPAAQDAGQALAIERLVVLKTANILSRLNERGRARGLFCRLSLSAICDRALVSELVAHLRSRRELTEHLVIEIGARDYSLLGQADRETLSMLTRAGFRLALEGAENLGFDAARLSQDKVGFVKIGPQGLVAEERHLRITGIVQKIADFRRASIDIILEGIADEGMAMLGNDCGVPLGQGNLFSEPKPLRAEVLGDTGAARVA